MNNLSTPIDEPSPSPLSYEGWECYANAMANALSTGSYSIANRLGGRLEEALDCISEAGLRLIERETPSVMFLFNNGQTSRGTQSILQAANRSITDNPSARYMEISLESTTYNETLGAKAFSGASEVINLLPLTLIDDLEINPEFRNKVAVLREAIIAIGPVSGARLMEVANGTPADILARRYAQTIAVRTRADYIAQRPSAEMRSVFNHINSTRSYEDTDNG